MPEVGDIRFGGIVFYVDSLTNSGYVASIQDLGLYEWGCYSEYQTIEGADNFSLGSGYQNTLDLINANCPNESGLTSAFEAASNYEYMGYSDWYLPSYDELLLMYNSISFGSNLFWVKPRTGEPREGVPGIGTALRLVVLSHITFLRMFKWGPAVALLRGILRAGLVDYLEIARDCYADRDCWI